jgi:hypothetical protein
MGRDLHLVEVSGWARRTRAAHAVQWTQAAHIVGRLAQN